MKSSELVVIVESVEEAIKFYTDKMAFDIVDVKASEQHPNTLTSAHLKKGKCSIAFRIPLVEELAEFSFIKRCASRCIALSVEMKKGLDKYFTRCQKKGVKIVSEPKDTAGGYRHFSIRDPFGTKLVFSQLREGYNQQPDWNFAGMMLTKSDLDQSREDAVIDKMVDHLRSYGKLSRRAAKKYAKQRLKQLAKVSK